MEILAGIGGVSTAIGLVAVIALAFKLVSALREQIAMRDLLDAERKQLSIARGELDTETAAHAATSDELRKEKDLRASAESERNQAHLKEREHVVEIIQKSNIADAAGLVSRILSAPLVSGLPPQVPAPKRSEDPRDGLLDPGL